MSSKSNHEIKCQSTDICTAFVKNKPTTKVSELFPRQISKEYPLVKYIFSSYMHREVVGSLKKMHSSGVCETNQKEDKKPINKQLIN